MLRSIDVRLSDSMSQYMSGDHITLSDRKYDPSGAPRKTVTLDLKRR